MTRRLMVLFLGLFCLGLLAPGWAGPRDAPWKKVDEAIKKGLPKTAIQELDPIIAAAIEDKAYAEAIKAIGMKIAQEGTIQGNKPEEKITRLQAEIAKAPKEMRPVMDAILAHWYWQYFQQNRWRFIQRTATAAPSGNDILTWDLPRILAEIGKQFQAALANAAELKKVPIAQYNDLLVKGTMPDAYRPTLYDFLAFEALSFFSSGEQAGARAEDAFELAADSPIFAAVEEFLDLEDQDDRRRVVDCASHPSLPGSPEIPRGRQGSVGLPRCRPGPATVRLQQGRWRREERPLQGRVEALRRGLQQP